MPASIFDSQFYQNSWGTPEMRAVFDDKRRYQRWLDIEAALARVQAGLGIIPAEAAREITAKAKLELIDLDFVKAELGRTQHSLVPLLRGLQKICDDGWGEYIHFGPTTQDIEDTGGILELKEAWTIILRDMRAVEERLMGLAAKHRDTLMCGRTHGQQALPITLGLKFATWLSEIHRGIQRLVEMSERLFVAMLHGGAGSMAGLGDKAQETLEGWADALGLDVPDVGWGNSRDRLGEYVGVLSLTAASLGKISNEIFCLSRSEIGEMAEGLPEGYVGSSTMPHKRNPEICEMVVALSRVVRSHLPAALEGVDCVNERDTRSWRIDWWALPQVSMVMSAMLSMTVKLLDGLEINTGRMLENLDMLHGLLLSEGLMFALGKAIGKQTAHHVIGEACMRVYKEKRPIAEVLMEMEEVSAHLSREDIEAIADYGRHVGRAGDMVDQVVAVSEARRATDPVAG